MPAAPGRTDANQSDLVSGTIERMPQGGLEMIDERQSGTVKWFDNKKGYGFIVRENENEDIFVHYREIRGQGYRTLNEGQRVEFTLNKSDKGLAAADVDVDEEDEGSAPQESADQ